MINHKLPLRRPVGIFPVSTSSSIPHSLTRRNQVMQRIRIIYLGFLLLVSEVEC